MLDSIEKLTLPEQEQRAATTVKDALAATSGPFLRTASGADVAIPAELAHLFGTVAEAAAQGHEITVTIGDPRLRPREAAAALGMSRTYLCELMDAGKIAFERVGSHRRIPYSEVERYRSVRATEIAARYAKATSGLPDAPDEPMAKLPGPTPRRKLASRVLKTAAIVSTVRRVRPRVFIDTNVWYPPSCRAMFLGVALSGMFEVVTSEGVLDELSRHLSVGEKTGLTAEQARTRADQLALVLVGCVADAVADVHAGTAFEAIGLPDPDDEHVVAGALAADADLLVTANLADFPDGLLAAHGLDVLSPDELCADGLRSMQPAWVEAVRYALKFPPQDVSTASELGMALDGCGMKASGGILLSASWQGI